MPTIVDVLQGESKEMQPEWLREPTWPRFNRNEFFKSRTIYYPGSGDDGQPVKLCALSHVAQCLCLRRPGNYCWNTLAERLVDQVRGFRGYKLVHDENVSKSQLRFGDWKKHIKWEETERFSIVPNLPLRKRLRGLPFWNVRATTKIMGLGVSLSCSLAVMDLLASMRSTVRKTMSRPLFSS